VASDDVVAAKPAIIDKLKDQGLKQELRDRENPRATRS
jgi:hypothetical protein